MPSTEEQVKSVILKHKGSARKQQIARELNLGLDYIDFVCRDLERKRKIVSLDGFYSLVASANKPYQRRSDVLRGKSQKFPNAMRKIYAESSLLAIPKMTKELIDLLEKVGYKTIGSLAVAPIARLMQGTKLKVYEAAGLINQARKILGEIKDSKVSEEEPRTRASSVQGRQE